MNSKLKVGIVGCGGHMYDFLYNCLKWAPDVTVMAVCDIEESKLDRFTTMYHIPNRYTDYHEMFTKESLDAIIVVINETQHYAVAKAAMLAGIHVFVEKTPGHNTQEVEELARIQEQTGQYTMVGFNRRFMTSYTLAKEISQRQEFGDILMYQSQFNTSPYRNDAFFRINHIIHHLDLARFLLGELTLTHADRVVVSEQMVGYTISFRSAKGAIGTIQSGSLLDETYPVERVELIGHRRNIVVDNVKSVVYNRSPSTPKDKFKPYALVDGGDALVWNTSHGLYPRFSYHGYEDELHYFFKCIHESKRPEPTVADSVQTMRLLDQLESFIAK